MLDTEMLEALEMMAKDGECKMPYGLLVATVACLVEDVRELKSEMESTSELLATLGRIEAARRIKDDMDKNKVSKEEYVEKFKKGYAREFGEEDAKGFAEYLSTLVEELDG